jgi:hypothetical protein
MVEALRDRRFAALCGMFGVAALGAYFAAPALLNWPYAGASAVSLTAYAMGHQTLFYLGAWLQITGTVLCVAFFLYLVRMAGASDSLTGTLVTVAATALLSTVLVEGALLVAVPMAAAADDTATVATTFALSNGVFVRVFPLAPSSLTYIALGLAMLSSPRFHRGYGFAAIAIGGAFELAGFAAVFVSAALIVIAVLAAGQALWILAVAIGLLRSPAAVPHQTPAALAMGGRS